jgi:SAM-dependent methyltransferase
MRDIKCPICNSASIKVALKLESPLGGLWDIHECENCAIQFIYPIPSPEELNRFYDQLYQGGSIERTKALTNPTASQKYWQRQWAIIKGLINNKMSGRVLDIGCGGGTFWITLELAGRSMGLNFQKTPERLLSQKKLKPLQHLRMQLFLMSSSM